jgi:hypothetical protein
MPAREAGFFSVLFDASKDSESLSLRASLLSIMGLSLLCWGMIGGSLFMVLR